MYVTQKKLLLTDTATLAGPVGVDPGAGGIQALVGVRAEVVTLGLEQVSGEHLVAQTIVEVEGGGEGGSGDTEDDGLGNDVSPGILGLGGGLLEEGIEEEVLKLGVVGVGILDLAQEGRADDTATAPHKGNTGVVQLPVVVLGGLAHQHEALGVRDNLGGIQSLTELLDEGLLVARVLLVLGASQDLGGTNTLVLERGQAASVHSLTNESDGNTAVKRVNAGPLAGTLLASSVADLGDKGGAILVLVLENVTGDFDQERVKLALVPLGEDLGHLVVSEVQTLVHDLVDLRDKLHVTILYL